MNLREVHGYTYGASSGFTEYRDGGLFHAGATGAYQRDGCRGEGDDGRDRNFPSKPSTAEELAAAKEATMRSLPGRFETTASVVPSALTESSFTIGRSTTSPIAREI